MQRMKASSKPAINADDNVQVESFRTRLFRGSKAALQGFGTFVRLLAADGNAW